MQRSEFDRKLAKLKDSNPLHPMIDVITDMGHTFLSAEYLLFALEDAITVTKEEYTVDAIFKKKTTLYSRRSQLSNKFHSCTTDQERANISIAIGSIQSEIIPTKRIIDAYYEKGKLPDLPEKVVIPMDGRAKQKKLHSVRSSRSRYRELLRQEKDPEKIKHYESELARIETEIGQLSA